MILRGSGHEIDLRSAAAADRIAGRTPRAGPSRN